MSTHTQEVSYRKPSLSHAVVADAMHPGVFMCHPQATLTEIARIMATNHIHCVVVAGESSGPDLVWGMISDLDLVRTGLEDPEQTAAMILERPILNVAPDTPLREAAELMCVHGISHVMVAEPARRRPVGILSTLDVADVMAWGEA